MLIFVDIDETICYYEGKRDYKLAKPHYERIEKINKWYSDGNTIVYWTARGSKTGIDWYDLTGQQLKQWGAKFHEYKVGKPPYDVFICDKAINTKDFFIPVLN